MSTSLHRCLFTPLRNTKARKVARVASVRSKEQRRANLILYERGRVVCPWHSACTQSAWLGRAGKVELTQMVPVRYDSPASRRRTFLSTIVTSFSITVTATGCGCTLDSAESKD